MSELEEVAVKLRAARLRKKEAEKTITTLEDRYFELLDTEVGKGQVTFVHDGLKFGRVVAEIPKFDLARFQSDYPELADDLLTCKTTWSLDEEAVNNYLAENPEHQALIGQYVTTTEQARWKNPVAVRDEE